MFYWLASGLLHDNASDYEKLSSLLCWNLSLLSAPNFWYVALDSGHKTGSLKASLPDNIGGFGRLAMYQPSSHNSHAFHWDSGICQQQKSICAQLVHVKEPLVSAVVSCWVSEGSTQCICNYTMVAHPVSIAVEVKHFLWTITRQMCLHRHAVVC